MDPEGDVEMEDVDFDRSSDVDVDNLPSLSDLEEEDSDFEEATGPGNWRAAES